MAKKIEIVPINQIDVTIKLDALALDSHPIDEKSGRSIAKRIIKLDYIKDGGIIKVPAQKWMLGWLKLLFKSRATGTVVLLPHKLDDYSLGTAKDLLVGRSLEEWKSAGDRSVTYELGEELKDIGLYPYHEYVPLQNKRTSIIRYYYKINEKSKPIKLLINTMISPDDVIKNMKNFGRIYGLGVKAGGYRIGTFIVQDSKVEKIGEVIL